jgi:hypothetical protein
MFKAPLAAAALTLSVVAAALFATQPASAATVPGAPASCAAAEVTGGVNVTWTPPASDGGAAIFRYVVRIKAQTTPVYQTDKTSDGVDRNGDGLPDAPLGGAARQWLWSDPYTTSSVFQVRAVNSLGYGLWCEAPLSGSPPPPVNQAPTVDAGADQAATLPAGVTLAGSASDDGLPAGSTLSTTWAKASGPGTVTFGNASSLNSSASFSVAGTYVLSLTASDGSLSSSDQTTITVSPPARPYIPFSSSAWMKQTIAQLGLAQNSTKTTAMRSYINSHDPHNAPNIQGLGSGWGDSWGGVVGCSDAVYKIGTGNVDARNSWLKTTGFHASAQMAQDLTNASSTGATDLPFEVVDRCGNSMFPTGFTVKGGHAAVVGGAGTAANPYVLNVLSAGAYGNDTNGLDYRVAGSDGPNNWSSRGVIAASATIRADQVQYGIDNGSDLGQRIELFWWETDSAAGKISPPMAGFESGQAGWGAEGQVVGVSPSFVPSASCTAGEKVVVRTLQTYGAYIGDNAGAGGTSLKGEQNHGQWAGLGLSQQGLANDCGLTWNDFVAYG